MKPSGKAGLFPLVVTRDIGWDLPQAQPAGNRDHIRSKKPRSGALITSKENHKKLLAMSVFLQQMQNLFLQIVGNAINLRVG